MNRVKDFKIGDVVYYNGLYWGVKLFPTRYSVCLGNLNPGTGGEPLECKVPLSELREHFRKNHSGAELIQEERYRQIQEERFSVSEDQIYKNGELAKAALCYALESTRLHEAKNDEPPAFWPWLPQMWKPVPDGHKIIGKKDSIHMLKRAGALIAAEIDRLQLEDKS